MTKQELASRIWAMANKLRSKVKANDYKDYILGFIFYKFLSEKELDFAKDQGMTDDEMKSMDDSDIEFFQVHLGYYISYDNLFSTWKAKGISLDAKTVSEAIDDFYCNVNPSQKKVFDHIFDTLQNGITELGDAATSRDKAVRDMVDMINTIPSNNDAEYDTLGYVYEYLIYKFATAAKDDGAFYTPHEVSRLIAQIVTEQIKDKKELRVYDPTSGSGSLLRTIGEEASRYIDVRDIRYYGQEKITATYHLTRMNLVMKGVASQNIIVRNGDTLEDDWPYFDENTAYKPLRVNAVVSNPPYSQGWTPESRAMDERFKKYGLAPSGKADYAFLLHCLYHLESDGVMAIVLPHGVLFRGDSEYEIRKNLCIEHNIETIIGLPENLFYATSIPTIIMILRKNRKSNDILFIDASQNYGKGKKQNILRESDIKRIFDAVKNRKHIDDYAELVSYDRIVEENYNLNIPRYVSAKKEQRAIDFAALMNGTVPNIELDTFVNTWNTFPTLRSKLFSDIGNGYSSFINVDIKAIVDKDESVERFYETYNRSVKLIRSEMINTLIRENYRLTTGEIKGIQDHISKYIMDEMKDVVIVDEYEAYQAFMDGWNTIAIDLGVFANNDNGLMAGRQIEPNMVLKKKGKEEFEVQEGYKGTIMPFNLIGEHYFGIEYEEVKDIQNEISCYETEYGEIYENLEEDVKQKLGDGEKFKESELKKYLKDNQDDDLENALKAISKAKVLKKQIKSKEDIILEKIQKKIEDLTEEEIKNLLIIKWIDPICKDLSAISSRIVNAFIKDMLELNQKYATPLSALQDEITNSSSVLSEMLCDLTGSSIDMAAIESLKSLL